MHLKVFIVVVLMFNLYLQMEISRYLRQHARNIAGKSQLFINSYAKALEVIPLGSMFNDLDFG